MSVLRSYLAGLTQWTTHDQIVLDNHDAQTNQEADTGRLTVESWAWDVKVR